MLVEVLADPRIFGGGKTSAAAHEDKTFVDTIEPKVKALSDAIKAYRRVIDEFREAPSTETRSRERNTAAERGVA